MIDCNFEKFNEKSGIALKNFQTEDLENLTEEIKLKLKHYGVEQVSIIINIMNYHDNTKINESNPILVSTGGGFALLHKVNCNL